MRYYAFVQGRFTSIDPGNAGANEAEPQSWNGYAYVYNMPLNFIDSDGLWAQVPCSSGEGMCWQSDNKSDTITSLAKIIGVSANALNRFFRNPTIHMGDVFDVSGFYLNNNTFIRSNIVQVVLVSAPEPKPKQITVQDIRYFFSDEASKIRAAEVDKFWDELLTPRCAREGRCMVGIMYPGGAGSGLRGASAGLQELFASGSIRNRPMIYIRNILRQNGFTQTISRNGQGYLFTNAAGEEVRIMSRNGRWDIRVRNAFGNYLDEYGNVGPPSTTHNITVLSR